MTLLYMDGCGDTRRNADLYADTTRYLTAASGGSTGFSTFTTGLFGATTTYCATGGSITTALVAETPVTSFVSVRVRSNTNSTATILKFISGTSTVQCFLRQTAGSGSTVKYQILRTVSTVLAESADYSIDGGTIWRALQIKVVIAASPSTAGSVSILVDDVAAVTVSSLTTSASGTVTDRLELLAGSSTHDVDDFAWASDQGSAPHNTFLGQVVLEGLFPNGIGNVSDWTPSAGNNYENVDDGPTASVTDADYVSTTIAATGITDTYTYQDLAVITSGILAVQPNAHFRLETTGSETVEFVARNGGTTTASGSAVVTGTGYQGKGTIWTANPVDVAAWDPADITSGEFGFQKTIA